jgi:hypothetical protein
MVHSKSQEALVQAQLVDGDACSDAPSKQSGVDQGKDAQDLTQVLQDVQRLERQLTQRQHLSEQLLAAEDNGRLGLLPPVTSEAFEPCAAKDSGVAPGAAAAAADDAVLLTVNPGNTEAPGCCCLPDG